MLHTSKNVRALEASAKARGFELVSAEHNPVDDAWQDQPAAPTGQAFAHEIEYAGKDSNEKRAKIAEVLREKDADALLLSSPDSVAWVLNIRGSDVARTPLVLARALIFDDGRATLFIDNNKLALSSPAFWETTCGP